MTRGFDEYFGTELPANAAEDSFSLLPLLKGNDSALRQHPISQSSQGLHCIRQGDWKLIFGAQSGGWSKEKEVEPMQLYNLKDDLGETTNLSTKYPEKLAELTDLMTQLVDVGRSIPGPSQQNDVDVQWKRFTTTEATNGVAR